MEKNITLPADQRVWARAKSGIKPLHDIFMLNGEGTISRHNVEIRIHSGWMERVRLIGIVMTLVLLGTLTLAIYHDREPCCQGRRLSEWLEIGSAAQAKPAFQLGLSVGNPETDPARLAASRALKQMAPDAIPLLLTWAQAKDSPMRVRLIIFWEEHPHFHVKIQPAEDRNDAAKLGFTLLGNEAKPAWPVLIRWTYGDDRERRLCALACLAQSSPGKETLMPVLLRLVQDRDKIVQLAASRLFSRLSPQDAEATGVYKLFPNLKNPPAIQIGADQARSM